MIRKVLKSNLLKRIKLGNEKLKMKKFSPFALCPFLFAFDFAYAFLHSRPPERQSRAGIHAFTHSRISPC